MQDEKYIEYAMKIRQAIVATLIEPEHEYAIDKNELNDEENLHHFIHAMATVAPCSIFNSIVDKRDELDHLKFNQAANSLCFQFCQQEQ